MSSKRNAAELLRRYVSFVFALFIIALGTSMSIRANLGSSPISCPPYVLSSISGTRLTMGEYVICMHVFFILTQIILLRRKFPPIQLLQIAVSFLFGFYTDLTMWMTGLIQFDNSVLGYVMRFVQLCVGGGLLAYGISFEVHCDVLMLAGEGLPLAISKVVHAEFGKVKIFSDTSLVIIGIVLMFIFIGGGWHWDMIGLGTLFSMFYVGFMVRKFSPHFDWLERFFNPSYINASLVIREETKEMPPVVTISREFGSRGHEIGELLSKKLCITLYDRSIIDTTAKDLGFTPNVVMENEQNISTKKLWELIFTDKSIPDSMNPSMDDAIFVSQSRTIMNIAEREPCVIVGRCANWVLRNDKNSFHVFVRAELEDEVNCISERMNLSKEEARQKILRVNRARANHYWKYTGDSWNNSRSYDLVVNSSKVSVDEIVEIICSCISKLKLHENMRIS